MTDIELLIDLHKDGERQGPGSIEMTKRALDLTGIDKNENLKIADIGCGTGAQTITLAENTNGHIIAVDLFPDFLEKLNKKTQALSISHKISTEVQSMDNLQFQEAAFDLIWSEGAIYIMGFEAGIKSWKKFLKPGGYLAVSELSWTTGTRPKEIQKYWMNEYPQIDAVSNKIKILEQNGFTPIAQFIVPSYCWLDNYYYPMQDRFDGFLERHHNSDSAKRIIENEREEIEVYKRFKDYYSYGFYIARKV
jgi:ubiquinone/menaquinone biosynthesis C-methylase UbiE